MLICVCPLCVAVDWALNDNWSVIDANNDHIPCLFTVYTRVWGVRHLHLCRCLATKPGNRGSSHGLTFTWWGCYGLCPRHKPTELAHSFYSLLVSVSVFKALSTLFHSVNSPDNSPLSHSVLLVLFSLIGPFNYISLYESLPQPWYNSLWLTGLKATSS